ncbi:MAG: hypothetical protein GXC78_02995 [Chitinophagaceae bacterium]|nr:hypothetical protein [Chitinophagaceae bacterium]
MKAYIFHNSVWHGPIDQQIANLLQRFFDNNFLTDADYATLQHWLMAAPENMDHFEWLTSQENMLM